MSTLTAEETELYDRQIRAWGVDAQKRMRESRILLIGLDGAGSETLKNLVLAGLGQITILENKIVNKTLIETHFYLQSIHENQKLVNIALQYFSLMNPNIKLISDSDDPYIKNDDFYKSFDVVIINNNSRYFQLKINTICHNNNIAFFSCRSIAAFGYIFADLQKHQFQIEKTNKNKDDNNQKESKILSLNWYSLSSALSISKKVFQKQLRGRKRAKHRSLFYSLQICETFEDKILNKNQYFINDQQRNNKIINAFKAIKDQNSEYFKIFKEIELKIKQSGQFDIRDMSDVNKLDNLINSWNLNICPSNAMLGGYLANFVMFYVQRKKKPLHNFLFFDLWSCEANAALMRSDKDIDDNNKMDIDVDDNDIDINKNNDKNPKNKLDLSALSVTKKQPNQNQIISIDDSDDDDDKMDNNQDNDIDLTK